MTGGLALESTLGGWAFAFRDSRSVAEAEPHRLYAPLRANTEELRASAMPSRRVVGISEKEIQEELTQDLRSHLAEALED